MAKTACEEAAIIIEAQAGAAYGKFKMILLGRAKRLRAEGQELSRLRKIIERVSAIPGWQHPVWKQIEREAARIQKERTK